MKYHEFLDAVNEGRTPAATSTLLAALWHDKNGDWSQAHALIQDMESREAAHLHAYLHRKEGDISNARYWYQRAGEKMPTITLEEEWHELAKKFSTDGGLSAKE